MDRAEEIKTLTHSTSAHESSPIFQEGIYG
jgi:hypothetical protein